MEESDAGLMTLPSELRSYINIFLNYRDLIGFCRSNAVIRKEICGNDFFWKNKTYYDFQDLYEVEMFDGNWRDNYEYYRALFSLNLIEDLERNDTDEIETKMTVNRVRKFLDPNRQNEDDKTALMWAASRGHEGILQELLALGADPNLKDDREFTALMYASTWGEVGVVRELLRAGADPSLLNKNEDTALSFGIGNLGRKEKERTEITKMLLEAGMSDVNAGRQSFTPLMIASRFGFTEIARMLLEAGADPNLKNENEETALDEASGEGHTEIVRMLEEVMRE